MPHPSGTGGLSALGLLTPLERPQFSSGIATLRASCCKRSVSGMDIDGVECRTFVLPVEGAVAAAPADSVRLGMSLTVGEGGGQSERPLQNYGSLTNPKDEVPRIIN